MEQVEFVADENDAADVYANPKDRTPLSAPPARGIYAKLGAIQSAIGVVVESGQMQGGGPKYKYLTDSDVVAAVNEHLGKHHLGFAPRYFQIVKDEMVAAGQGQMRRVVLVSDWVLGDGETGEVLEISGVPGEAIGTFDKTTQIALTYARKSALRLLFNVASEEPQSEPAPQQQRPQPAPQQQRPQQQAPRPPAASTPQPAAVPPPLPGSAGWEPWGSEEWDRVKMGKACAAELFAHGWTDKEQRDRYIKANMGDAYARSDIPWMKEFYRAIYMGKHNPTSGQSGNA